METKISQLRCVTYMSMVQLILKGDHIMKLNFLVDPKKLDSLNNFTMRSVTVFNVQEAGL